MAKAPTPCRLGDRREQRGAVLVMFALLLVGVFGLLGVVLDAGRMRVVEQQLDAGVESAALEGLRFKDLEGDAHRRTRAIVAIARQWDDDLDPSNGDTLGVGAGPLPIVAGTTALGGDLLVAPEAASRMWKPAEGMQQNLGNATHGDLVAGAHLPGGPPIESDSFERADFLPAGAGSSPAQLAAAPALLVRLRRATARLALDRRPGESSSGPAMEWLWARGSAWLEPGADGGEQGRADGTTVRATAIAASEPALVVSDHPTGWTALATFALRSEPDSPWQTTPSGSTLTLELGANGELTLAGAEAGVALASPARAVGGAMSPAAAPPTDVPPTVLVVPVYAIRGGDRRVLGFTLATAEVTGSSLTITRRPAAVLPTGASSVASVALDARVALAGDPGLRALHDAVAEPVLAPVLRR